MNCLLLFFLAAAFTFASAQLNAPFSMVKLSTNVNQVPHGEDFNLTCEYELSPEQSSKDWEVTVSFRRRIMMDEYDMAEFKRTWEHYLSLNSLDKR